ncbi:MAG TPA: FKBP-type peptidyl-prolyl cis-trans isomerase [Acidimicrobiia bacterium]|jgi:peptidylprolyl isomerase
MRRLPGRTAVCTVLLAGVLIAAGCGSSSTKASTNAGAGGSTGTKAPAASGTNALAEIKARGKPTVTVPKQPADKLEIHDDIVGTGATVKAHDTVTVHYVGVGQLDGKQFDASWDRGQPTQFPLDGVIPGWGEGLVGMKVGGRRTLVIPGNLAYGNAPPQGSGIEPNETLVFVVDLVSIP